NVDGSLPNDVRVNAGGTLGGTGSTGDVTSVANGTVSPGDAGPGILTSKFTDLAPGSTLDVQLNGTTPGTGYDRLAMASGGEGIDIDAANLMVSAGFTAVIGDTFTVVTAPGTGNASVHGVKFAGLPDRSILTAGGQDFEIRYTATEVTLT